VAGSGRRNADGVLVAALVGGATVGDAARRARVGEQTARRRLRDPDFRARLVAATDELVAATARALTEASGAAVGGLLDLIKNGPPAVRLGACRAILELGPRWKDAHDDEERLAAVEAALRDERRP
jgi:hypothetical protein